MWCYFAHQRKRDITGTGKRAAPRQSGADLVPLGCRPGDRGHHRERAPAPGTGIAGRVLAFPYGKGSTVGSYVLYALSRNGHAPAAIVNTEAEAIIATGAIIGRIPMIDRIGVPLGRLKSGIMVTVDGDRGGLDYDSPLTEE